MVTANIEQVMIEGLTRVGDTCAIEIRGDPVAHMNLVNEVLRDVGKRFMACYGAEECDGYIQVKLADILRGSPLLPRRGPEPKPRPWHALSVGDTLILERTQVKQIAHYRVMISQYGKKTRKRFSVVQHPLGWLVTRTE